MTKKEYMKKLAYQLRRLPKEDFDKAMDYFEEYFEDAGIENEQKAIEDLGAPEEAASALILDLAQENAVKPPKTMKRRFSALWIAILHLPQWQEACLASLEELRSSLRLLGEDWLRSVCL